ncbi:MAG: MATE family efflux transporter [Pseudomonadota bacterium]
MSRSPMPIAPQSPRPARFLTGDLMRHIIVMSLSASVGLVALFVVDFVDLYFISMLGDTALTAAVGFAGTLMAFGLSVSIGLMIAMSALGARRIGAGDEAGARALATSVLTLGSLVGVAFAAVFWIFAPQLLALLGASGDAQSAAVRYLRIVMPAMPVMAFAMICSGLLRAHGDARRAMNVTLFSALANAVLDPILIFGFGLGLDGAAWASVLARLTMCATAAIPILRHYGGFAPFRTPQVVAHIRPIVGIAAPAILTNLATPVGIVFVTRAIAAYGDAAVAGYSVLARLMPLAFCVIFALSGAVGPIVGQNFGASQFTRVRETIIKSIQFTAIYTAIMWAMLLVGQGFIADQFSISGVGREIIFWFAAVAAPLLVFNGILFVCNAVLNNLDRPLWSTYLNWGRNTLGVIPFVILGSQVYGAPGVVIGQYAGGIVFAALGLWLSLWLVDHFARHHREGGRADGAAPVNQPASAAISAKVQNPSVSVES